MHYRVGYDWYIMIAIMVASVLHVGLATPLDRNPQELSGATPPPQSSRLLSLAQNSVGETVKTTEKMVWGVGKFLLGAGESINYVMDVALGTILNLLKAGGKAYDSVAVRVSHVPVIGFSAVGIGEAMKTALEAMDSDVKHNIHVRKNAFETLNHKMTVSGARLQQSSASTTTSHAPTTGNRCAPEGEPAPATAEADGQSQSSSGLSSFVSKTMNEVSHIGSEVSTATEETLKVVGRLSVAAAHLLMKLLDGASHTTAAAGNVLATGVKQVNKYTGPVPMLGTVTTGVQNAVVGVTDTYSENSKFNIARRNQLAQEWLGQVNSFTPGTASSAAGGSTDAAAPPAPAK